MSNFWLALDELQKDIEAKIEQKFDEMCCENGGALMGVNARFLNEARELEKRWSEAGLDGHFNRRATAVMLESQRLMNEQPKDILKERYEKAVRALYEDEEENEITLFLKESKRQAEARKYRCPTTG